MKKRTAKVFAMTIASLFVLSACSGTASNQTSTGETAGAAGTTDTTVPSSTGQSSGGNHFTYVIGTEPLTMDTHLMSDANTGRVSVQIHENLVKRDLEGNFQPVLATEWSPNEDATEWTFKLREGAIDRDAIINGILGGYVTYPSTGVISSSIQNAKQGIGDDYKYDPEKAKQLLAEAGYPDGFTTKINTPEGRYAMDRQVAEAIQAMLSQVGITAEVNVLDWGAYTEAAAAGDTEIFLLGKGCATGDLAQDLMYNYRTGELQNYTFYSNPEYDKVCEEQQRTADENARKELLYKMQDIIHEDRASIILYYENQTFGTRADVSGLVIYPNETIELAYLARK